MLREAGCVSARRTKSAGIKIERGRDIAVRLDAETALGDRWVDARACCEGTAALLAV